MKTNHIAVAAASLSFLAIAGLAIPRLARADAHDEGLGTWEGSGMATEAGGKDLGPFTIALTRTSLGGGGVRTDGTIHTSDGKDVTFWQEMKPHGNGRFSMTSDLGAGGGCCFTNDMCQSLQQKDDGHAFATTIAKDGPAKLRVLVTELQGGRATRFYAQTLAKKP